MSDINVVRRPPLTNDRLNRLFESAWPSYRFREFTAVLDRSAVYVAAFCGDRLVGFVNVAWDGGVHGFVVDLIRFGGHLPKGGYDVRNGRNTKPASPPAVHG
jgi:hypothetical protein